ncbi:3-keto-5-aminohexanoate cleavage enzyme [Vibrio sp. B1FIG11]|uniref:3-keto-5-aminohexanoate cleavage protein n=1 Tax=Vibrio sp. B1FIG11 TaxID=2751177 RepID=UPI001AF1CA96|nr:3-keto-5-aminohexanoate cleavage protein [Vibrio sp. B1FIG11]CAD7800498.1 3-keto-5-aminohexanoate cleavage enzyme [Vibrio sp. B1FIG11]CAE6887674.1 3-keto-5-aminohexanoate cleavage enzyme [Vibrio sp. B1FIG11]
MVVNSQTKRARIAIIVAPNGARKTKQDHAQLPINIEEMVAEAKACQTAGATMIHLHARDAQDRHSLEVDDNLEIYHAVKAAVGDSMIVQLTTEAVGMYSPQQQMALIKAVKPEAASFALRELIPDEQSEEQGFVFFDWVAEQGILSQIILYDQADIERYFSLRERGVLPKQNQHALVVLGRYHEAQQSSPWDLRALYLERFIEENVRCAVCAFGAREQDCLTHAMLLGLDVRVGFENNHLSADGQPANCNAEQVQRLKEVSKLLDVPLHDAESFRESI